MMWWKNNVPIWMVHPQISRTFDLLLVHRKSALNDWITWMRLVGSDGKSKEGRPTYLSLPLSTCHYIPLSATSHHFFANSISHYFTLRSLCFKVFVQGWDYCHGTWRERNSGSIGGEENPGKRIGRFDGVWGKLKPRLLMNSHFERWLSWYRRERLGLPLGELQNCWTQWIWVHRFSMIKGIVNWMLPNTISVKTVFGQGCLDLQHFAVGSRQPLQRYFNRSK